MVEGSITDTALVVDMVATFVTLGLCLVLVLL